MSRRLSIPGPQRRILSRCAALVAALAVATFTVYWSLAGGCYVCGEAWRVLGSTEKIQAYVTELGLWAPVVFVFLPAAQVLVALVPTGPLTLAGVVSFGFWGGLLLSVGGTTLGSVVAFRLGRRWGRPVAAKIAGRKALDTCAEKLSGRTGRVLFVAMVLPIPAGGDAVCALAGLTAISTKRFVLVVLAGRLPGTTASALLSAGFTSGLTGLLVVGATVLVLVVLALIYKCNAPSSSKRSALPEASRAAPQLPDDLEVVAGRV